MAQHLGERAFRMLGHPPGGPRSAGDEAARAIAPVCTMALLPDRAVNGSRS